MPRHCNISNLTRLCIIVGVVLKKIYFETYKHQTELIFELIYFISYTNVAVILFTCLYICMYIYIDLDV